MQDKPVTIKIPGSVYRDALKIRLLYAKWTQGAKVTFGQLVRMGIGAIAKHMEKRKAGK